MNLTSVDPSRKDLLLPLKRDAALWCWCPGVDSKDMVEAMLASKYVNERSAAKGLAEEAWANRTALGSLIQHQGLTKRLTSVEQLNERYAQLNCRGQGRATIRKHDFSIIADKDFEKEVAGEVVFGGLSKKGEIVLLDAKESWLGSYNRSVFNEMAFTSAEVSSDVYNLFPGFDAKPQPGVFTRIFRHIVDVICAGDSETAEKFISLLAWQVQNIGEPSRIIVALKSNAHQTGKSIFLTKVMAKIYGHAGLVTSDTEKILGRFNSSLKGKAFVCLEEALFAKSKKDSDKIKSLVTLNELPIEAKFVDTIVMPIAINLFLSTNHDVCAYIEPKDRRYWILNVSEHRVGDDAYFDALVDEIVAGGVESFFQCLLEKDVSNFVPWRDVPMENDAKLSMIEMSLPSNSSYIWIKECALTNSWLGSRAIDEPCSVHWNNGIELDFSLLYEWYQKWATTHKSFHGNDGDCQKVLATNLALAGIDCQRTSSSRKRHIIPSDEVCYNLDKAFRERLIA